jgi:DNA-binding MarR family transcriptional regulator
MRSAEKYEQEKQTEIKKEIPFMATPLNIFETKRELRKQLTPTQCFIVDEIHFACVFDNRNFRAAIDLNILAERVGITVKKLFAGLKILEAKGIITRQETPHARIEILGLNEEMFGQVLINSLQEKVDQKLRLVVDNHQMTVPDRSQSGPNRSQPDPNRSQSGPDESQSGMQVVEIIDEDFPRYVDTLDALDKRSENTFSVRNGNGDSDEQAAKKAEAIKSQIRMRQIPKAEDVA